MTPAKILLIEDNPGDARLASEALKSSKIHNELQIVQDGEAAIDYLHKRGDYQKATTPDIIFLDLNLPKKDGREVLAEVKSDETLKKIPIVILTTSDHEEDVLRSYNLHANCYITKPLDFNQFRKVIESINNFWLSLVKLPPASLDEF